MLMADYPKIEVKDDAIYKVQNLSCYDGRHHVQVAEIMITKDAFVEAYNKWIGGKTDENSDK